MLGGFFIQAGMNISPVLEGIMEKKTAGLLGALAGLAAMGTAQAAIAPPASPAEALHVSSYADLLAPVPDAVAVLKADDALRARMAGDTLNGAQLAQNYYGQQQHHHHHHHHHNQYRPPRHHHHHSQYRRPAHHHHHHHHQQYQ